MAASSLADALQDRYVLERELGRGGMATVYLAHDRKHDRAVALKVLRAELGSALGAERFLLEIRIVAGFTHPHILPLHDSGEAGGLLYYVMPFVEGESLRARLLREGRLPLQEGLRLTRQIADALAYAHDRGVVHRDIKPENILLEAGHAVLSDFGVARAISLAAGERLTEEGLAVGSPDYMSPEQALGESRIDGRADVYALGCVLYEMLAGAPPFQGGSAPEVLRQHLAATPRALSDVRADVTTAVSQAVARAMAKAPGDRWATAAEFSAALAAEAPPPAIARRPGRSPRVYALGAGFVLALGAGLLLSRSNRDGEFEPDLLAVAPFAVFGPGLELWGEGLADMLAASLDGAGPVRTVSPTVVVRRWVGRADPAAAAALGRKTRARVVVLGQLTAAGVDSVRARVTLVDAAARRPFAEFEVRDLASRMDRLADTTAVAILRELSSGRSIGAYRIPLGGLGTGSLPALKAFLQAEQFYRRAADDSAVVYYERATRLDSTFAVAFRHLGWARWGRRAPGDLDSLMYQDWLRAGALNRGLPARESLLVAIDSLQGAIGLIEATGWPGWQLITRYVAMAEACARRFPQDPEAWYELGEARLHWGREVGIPLEGALEAFDRAIALDSAFATAWYHGLELALALDKDSAARRYADGYLAQRPSGGDAATIRLAARLLDARPGSGALERILDTVSFDAGLSAATILLNHVDSAELGVRMARQLTAKASRESADIAPISRFVLAGGLAYRGHLRESYEVVGNRTDFVSLFAELAWLGAVPADSLHAVTVDYLAKRSWGRLNWLLPAWAELGDTGVLGGIVAAADSHAGTSPGGHRVGDVGRAYLALAGGDSAEALQRFLALPDSITSRINMDRLTKARLLAAQARLADAAGILRQAPPVPTVPSEVVWRLERAEVQRRLGEREQAIAGYRRVVRTWRDPDPQLEPYVGKAARALATLSSKP